MQNHLLAELEQRGYKAAFVGLERLAELEHEVNSTRRSEVAPEVYSLFLDRLQYGPPPVEGRWESILVVASPQSTSTLDFVWQGRRATVQVPPTYVQAGRSELERCIEVAVPGIAIKPVRLPLKLLAARAGLVKYGRNNITYAPRMGSFHMLFGYYTAIQVGDADWKTPELLPRCADCRLCITNCPTDCIESDRFIIRAEKCLTSLNELEGDFPDWLPVTAHNALIGCMRCQDVCPENKAMWGRQRHVMSFTAEETEALMDGLPAIEASATLSAKLKSCDLWTASDLLPRNLRAVLAAQGLTT